MSHPILQHAAKLPWSDYVELMPVKDEKTRKRLEQRIIKEDLNRSQIRQILRKIRFAGKKAFWLTYHKMCQAPRRGQRQR